VEGERDAEVEREGGCGEEEGEGEPGSGGAGGSGAGGGTGGGAGPTQSTLGAFFAARAGAPAAAPQPPRAAHAHAPEGDDVAAAAPLSAAALEHLGPGDEDGERGAAEALVGALLVRFGGAGGCGAWAAGARRTVSLSRARHGAALSATALLRTVTPAVALGGGGWAVAAGAAPAVRACLGAGAAAAGADRLAALRALAAGDAAAAAGAGAGRERGTRRASRGAPEQRLVEMGVSAEEWAEALRPLGAARG